MHATEPRPFRWTREEFWKLFDTGCFNGRRVELIEGEIVEMPAQKNFHLIGISLTEAALQQAFGANHWVRVQGSLDLTPHSVPDPDLAVVPGTPRSYAGQPNPSSALLVVEVSDTTLWYDRGRKASLYAAAGIADYWVLNLVDRQLEVYRDPAPDPNQMYGFAYTSRVTLLPGQSVAPLAVPGAAVAVDDLLP